MKFDYQYKITFDYNEPLDIDFINNVCKKYPNKNILVEVKNTKGITSSELKNLNSSVKIRVSGGYDEQRVKINKGKQYKTGETGEYYENSVIYTRNELIKILEEIEYIERGIDIEIIIPFLNCTPTITTITIRTYTSHNNPPS